MKVLIRADASNKTGYGHVARCLVIAKEMLSIGATVRLVCAGELGVFRNKFLEIGVLVDEIPSESETELSCGNGWIDNVGFSDSYDVLIVDNYFVNSAWEMKARKACKVIVAIDDLANRQHDCDILIDQSYDMFPGKRYENLIPRMAVGLYGLDFSLVRSDFFNRVDVQEKHFEYYKRKRRVLVSFGGADCNNVTSFVLGVMQKLSPLLEVKVVLAKNALFYKEVQALLSTFESAELIVDGQNMDELMRWADFSIGAGGGTALERCCIGLPTIVISTAANQMGIIKGLIDKKAVCYLGHYDKISFGELYKKLEEFVNNVNILEELGRNSLAALDGQGARRILDAILVQLKKRNYENISL